VKQSRPSSATLEPHDAKEVDDPDPQTVENTVFRDAISTGTVIDPHRTHHPALAQHQGRKKSVHVIEVWQIQKKRARKQL
jgi:hypothetical protein